MIIVGGFTRFWKQGANIIDFCTHDHFHYTSLFAMANADIPCKPSKVAPTPAERTTETFIRALSVKQSTNPWCFVARTIHNSTLKLFQWISRISLGYQPCQQSTEGYPAISGHSWPNRVDGSRYGCHHRRWSEIPPRSFPVIIFY